MLEFAARDYLDLCHRFGIILGMGRPPDPDVVRDVWSTLLKDTSKLGLPVTREHILCLFEEFVRLNPASLKSDATGFSVVGAQIPLDVMQRHVETIYKTLKAELGSILLRAIPREKSRYCNPAWLNDATELHEFNMVDEFQKAGRCFAYGENTACIFHLMRITDFCLRAVAKSINAGYDARTWQEIGRKINEKMEQKYQIKSDDWKQKEPFYAEMLTDLQAISRGHRNAALHELEKKYDEREALYMLTVIESFARHVAKNVKSEGTVTGER